MNIIKKTLHTLGLCLSMTSIAQALPMEYNFEYEFSGGEVLSGMLEGELQMDGDTILISRLGTLAFTGLPDLEFTTVLVPGFNITSLSGNTINLLSEIPDPSLGLITIREPFPNFGRIASVGFVLTSGSPSNPAIDIEILEPYSRDRWSITQKPSAVATPTSLAMVFLGLGLMLSRSTQRDIPPIPVNE